MRRELGRIDILIHNLGRSEPGGPAEMEAEVWNRQIGVNLESVHLFSHIVRPIVEKQAKGSVIINISVAGQIY